MRKLRPSRKQERTIIKAHESVNSRRARVAVSDNLPDLIAVLPAELQVLESFLDAELNSLLRNAMCIGSDLQQP